MKAHTPYFIQPGDTQIRQDVTLSLDEIKGMYNCLLRQQKVNADEGYISKPNTDMLSKLEPLIVYLQKEHYPNNYNL